MIYLGVYRVNPTTVAYFGYDEVTFYGTYFETEDSEIETPEYAPNQYLGSACNGTTRVNYYFGISLSGYTYQTNKENSPYCAFVPSPCDLVSSLPGVVTNETAEGANDGTIRVFASSSHPVVYYSILATTTTNTTGYFTGLAPGDYEITIYDALGCTLVQNYTVYAFEPLNVTRYKYRLRFFSVKDNKEYELRFLDQRNYYNDELYPIDLMGTDSPVIKKTVNPNEDKTEFICPTSLSINLIFDGETFEVDEFATAPERQWKIELYKDGELDFQGWLLPDEIQDFYADAKYALQFIATDGLLSLKGSDFGDLSLTQILSDGVATLIPIIGLRKWVYFIRICLEQLGYDYGETTLVSSLIYNTYNSGQWLEYSTWGDQFYDQYDTPVSVYEALDILLRSLKLQIFQHKGKFILWDTNDVYYKNKNTTAFPNYIWEFNKEFTTVDLSTNYPVNDFLGYNRPTMPINPKQTKNYDKAYNKIIGKADFNLLSILYENPGFEISPVEGVIPDGFYLPHGGLSEYGLTDDDAYSGKWSWKIGYNTSITYPESIDHFAENDPPFFTVDQPNKTGKISFMWKPSADIFTGFGSDWGIVPSFNVVFIDGTSGTAYFLKTPNYRPYNIRQYFDGDGGSDLTAPSVNTWTPLDGATYGEKYWDGDAVGIKAFPTRDTTGWQSFSLDTGAFPESGIGQLVVRFYGASFIPFEQVTIFPPLNMYYGKESFFFYTDTRGYYLLDNLNITLGDALDQYQKQIGERHTVVNLNEYSKSEKKEVDLKMFTYPTNKRMSGNFFYGDEYESAAVQNNWKFALSPEQGGDRLPANVIKRVAKTYQRPMYKWQGDVYSEIIHYYVVFAIDGIPNKVFIPFTIEMDLRNNTGNIVLIEVDDTLNQFNYTYTPIFEKSARSNN